MTSQTKHMVSIEKRTMSHEEVDGILRLMTPRPRIETSDHFWYISSYTPEWPYLSDTKQADP
ncbi:unnamed protein product [Clonostachys byssicola]|uniref:Uncharacterized protein n=1 Tax=Clonostachys byssicola TaxID=160290 RepID=A0A9N9UIA8_9HYPO|nr:unnamed protein product [Clonostachys byssicola]